MTELRVVGRSADGEHIDLLDSEGNSFRIRVSDNLRSLVNERRLTSVSEESVRMPLREVQARLRAGQSYAEVSRESGLSLEKIERYASPILQERAWIIAQAEKSSPKGTSLSLQDLVHDGAAEAGSLPDELRAATGESALEEAFMRLIGPTGVSA